jgi:hypothetical protein
MRKTHVHLAIVADREPASRTTMTAASQSSFSFQHHKAGLLRR